MTRGERDLADRACPFALLPLALLLLPVAAVACAVEWWRERTPKYIVKGWDEK